MPSLSEILGGRPLKSADLVQPTFRWGELSSLPAGEVRKRMQDARAANAPLLKAARQATLTKRSR